MSDERQRIIEAMGWSEEFGTGRIGAQRAEALLDEYAPAQWTFTPEGHDDGYEYLRTFECDGTPIAALRRTPRRVVDAGEWERVDDLPPVETRRLHEPTPGEEVRP